MTVPLVRCSALPMFEGRPLIVTAKLEASQVELTVLHKRNGAFFDLTRLHFCDLRFQWTLVGIQPYYKFACESYRRFVRLH